MSHSTFPPVSHDRQRRPLPTSSSLVLGMQLQSLVSWVNKQEGCLLSCLQSPGCGVCGRLPGFSRFLYLDQDARWPSSHHVLGTPYDHVGVPFQLFFESVDGPYLHSTLRTVSRFPSYVFGDSVAEVCIATCVRASVACPCPGLG